jgi:hypothetical protein
MLILKLLRLTSVAGPTLGGGTPKRFSTNSYSGLAAQKPTKKSGRDLPR